MEWVLWWALVVGFAIALIVPYRWTDDETEIDRDSADESPDRTGAPLLAHGIAVYAHEDETVPAPDPGRCQSCGADNDASYTYCRQCVSPLR